MHQTIIYTAKIFKSTKRNHIFLKLMVHQDQSFYQKQHKKELYHQSTE